MIKNPRVYVKVPVRYKKGYFIHEERAVNVDSINFKNETMDVVYTTDMYDNGCSSEWVVTLSIDAFSMRYRV